jgi:hypothetical protein
MQMESKNQKSKKSLPYILVVAAVIGFVGYTYFSKESNEDSAEDSEWAVDFFDDFDTFNPENWQDQRIWVNDEKQCYVPDNEYGTREVSDGTLKVKVINIGEKIECDNMDKHGNQHPDTEYVAGRIASKTGKSLVKENGQHVYAFMEKVKRVCFPHGGF